MDWKSGGNFRKNNFLPIHFKAYFQTYATTRWLIILIESGLIKIFNVSYITPDRNSPMSNISEKGARVPQGQTPTLIVNAAFQQNT